MLRDEKRASAFNLGKLKRLLVACSPEGKDTLLHLAGIFRAWSW